MQFKLYLIALVLLASWEFYFNRFKYSRSEFYFKTCQLFIGRFFGTIEDALILSSFFYKLVDVCWLGLITLLKYFNCIILDTLIKMDRNQLQKLAQYLIASHSDLVLSSAQSLAEGLLDEESTMNKISGKLHQKKIQGSIRSVGTQIIIITERGGLKSY